MYFFKCMCKIKTLLVAAIAVASFASAKAQGNSENANKCVLPASVSEAIKGEAKAEDV